MSKHIDDEEIKSGHERWLLTYSDMITLLLVLFIVMYTMSSIDAKKFQEVAEEMGTAFNGKKAVSGTIDTQSPVSPSIPLKDVDTKFDKVYDLIKDNLRENGLQGTIDIEKGDNFILLTFRDTVLFYPDSSNMKSEGYNILKNISNILLTINNNIQHIQIDGHTAKVSPDRIYDSFSWQLSSDRAISVLKYMVLNCKLAQSKMSIAAYANFVPISNNNNEEGRAKNRRVEIKITKVKDK